MASIKIMQMPRGTMRYQRGNGLLGTAMGALARVLRPLLTHGSRVLKPVLKQTAKKLGSQAIQLGTDVLSDIAIDKKPWKESVKKRAKENLPNLKRVVKEGVLEGGKSLVKGLDDKTQLGQGRASFKAATPSKRPATSIFTFPTKKKLKKSRQKSAIFD